MGMGFAPTWLRHVSPPPSASHDHFDHWRSLNYLVQKLRETGHQIDSRAVADLAHHVLLRTLIQSMIWHPVQSEGAPGTHKTTRQTAIETGISWKSVGRITKKTFS